MDKSKKENNNIEAYVIRFNEVDSHGNVFLPDSINYESLNQMKIAGRIKDYKVDENGIRIIKDFEIESASISSFVTVID